MRSASAASPFRWGMIALAFFATTINYLDRQALSVAAPILRMQFHVSEIGYSRIVFAFMLAYTIMNGTSGIWIDRLGARFGYGLFVGWWSLCALPHAGPRSHFASARGHDKGITNLERACVNDLVAHDSRLSDRVASWTTSVHHTPEQSVD